MPRRARRPQGARPAGGSDSVNEPTPIRFLAAELFGNNPRLVVTDGKRFATLKIEPAWNTRLYYSRRGEREAVEGVVGAAVVVDDPTELLEIDENGRMRIRVLSVDELEAFAWRLLRYAQILRIVNALGLGSDELSAAYFGRSGGRRGGGSGAARAAGAAHEATEELEEDTLA